MPELPEVESFRRQAMRTLDGRRLAEVNLVGDAIVFEKTKAKAFKDALTGKRVIGSGRLGKHMWLDVEGDGPSVLFHFGMSGRFEVYRSVDDRPSYWKIELVTDEGERIALRMPRRLGRVRLRRAPLEEAPLNQLGFDPYNAMPPGAEFRERLQKRKRPVKALLLDQKFAAGIGNWIADEVLFQAKIHPAALASSLRPDEIERLRKKVISVLAKAVDVEADADRFPKSWLFHHRWGKNADAKTAKGDPIAFTEVGGRTTAFVPNIQGSEPPK